MKYIILICLFFGFSTAYGQNTTELKPSDSIKFRHSMGLAAYSDAGAGFSYRYQPNKLGFEITGSPTYIGREKLFIYSIGAKGIYNVYDGSKFDLFSYIGTHLAGYKGTAYENDRGLMNVSGIGAGMDIPIFDVLSFNFQIGYGFYVLKDSEKPADFFTTISGGFGIYYNF